MIRRIAHIAIATDSIAVTSQFYKSLGSELDRDWGSRFGSESKGCGDENWGLGH